MSKINTLENKEELVTELKALMHSLHKVEGFTDEIEELRRREKEIQSSESQEGQVKVRVYFTLILWGIPIVIALLFLLAPILGDFGAILAFIIAGIVCIVKIKCGIEELDKEIMEELRVVHDKRSQVEDEFKEFWKNNRMSERIRLVPKEYMDSTSVNFFVQVLSVGRADTMKEAMNLYENHLHQERMLENSREALFATEQIAAKLDEHIAQNSAHMATLEKNLRSTARATKTNTVISILGLLR